MLYSFGQFGSAVPAVPSQDLSQPQPTGDGRNAGETALLLCQCCSAPAKTGVCYQHPSAHQNKAQHWRGLLGIKWTQPHPDPIQVFIAMLFLFSVSALWISLWWHVILKIGIFSWEVQILNYLTDNWKEFDGKISRRNYSSGKTEVLNDSLKGRGWAFFYLKKNLWAGSYYNRLTELNKNERATQSPFPFPYFNKLRSVAWTGFGRIMLKIRKTVPIPNASMRLCGYSTSIPVRLCYSIFWSYSHLRPQLNTLHWSNRQ